MMADNDDLTNEQTEQLLQYQDLTGIDDIARCREVLQRHNWDIETAVQDTFNEREGAPRVFNQPEPRQPSMNLEPLDQRVFTIGRRQPQGLVQWGYYLLLFPFRFVYITVWDILRFFYRLIRPDPRRNVTDPLGDVMKFIRSFEEKYGSDHPVFYHGTYSQALNDAKRELKFLLVYLHGDDHEDTDEFCRKTLCSERMYDFVASRVLFWACSTNSPEGYRVSQALRENTYPFLALVVLRDNRMTVVAKIEGLIVDTGDLVTRLENIMRDNEGSLIAARADREERSFNQTLRLQQDEAYLESLKADQEKERKKREEREKQEVLEQRVRDEEYERLRLMEERENRKHDLMREIPDEPAPDDPDAIRIMLKVPSGIRLERRFLKSQSLKYLYYYVFCHKECPDNFSVVSNYPRRTLECEPTDSCPEPMTFEKAGLGKSEMLFIHDHEA
ncbi:FAS-associated factor 2-like [Gigantopelta aegis]|uniref:FAS-associated factor 2-like n=1 Tax=Gigantopelta aegis TaxID=1735272 RepID=UPI001B889633|nr:FAS-associated factor 2-like [Gigantopelta aegis]